MNKAERGAASELMACAYLLSQGYEVLRNVSRTGKVDIAAFDPATGEVRLYDVKTFNTRLGLSKAQRLLGVRLLYVEPTTGLVTERWAEAHGAHQIGHGVTIDDVLTLDDNETTEAQSTTVDNVAPTTASDTP